MKNLMITLFIMMSATAAFANAAAENCGCKMNVTIELAQSERGFIRLVDLSWTEASTMISKSEYLDMEDRKDAAEKAGASGRIEFYMLETTEYSGVKQEVIIVSAERNCQITGRYTTYLE